MRTTGLFVSVFLASVLGCTGAAAAGERATMTLEVDASDLPRQLLRSRMSVSVEPGQRELCFVVWTPGNHTPSGPIENLVELIVRDCAGRVVPWDRDPAQVERFTVVVPEGCDRVEVSLAYIAGQPNANSRSTDSYGRPTMGVLNWNTVLLYPCHLGHQDIEVAASLGLPAAWSFATSLRARGAEEGERFGVLRGFVPDAPITWTAFESVALGELIDSPVIMGRHLAVYEMEAGDAPAHSFCVVAEDERATEVPGWLLDSMSSMVRQCMALFATTERPAFPRDRYLFLLALGEGLRFGVEHAESTLIGTGERVLLDAKREPGQGGGGGLGVVPHEYFHTWCGKLAAPEGLVSQNFHTPAHTELLWVYEGLTSYYDDILSVRSGMTTFDEFLNRIRDAAVTGEQRTGRLWRSVEDSARAARHLRQRGLYWHDTRQGQEYYGQGAQFWMEADALIRRGTEGERSLDDFCRRFFDVPVRPVGNQHTFARADVVRALGGVYPGVDWDALITERLERPAASLDMNPLMRLVGYRLVYSAEPTPAQERAADRALRNNEANLRESLGLRVNAEGEVIDVVPGSPADRAGLGWGMRIVSVGEWEYAAQRLLDAVADSVRTGSVELSVAFGGRIDRVSIGYAGGPRYPRLERLESEPDLLRAIAEPLSEPAGPRRP